MNEMMSKTIEKGRRVELHFSITLDNGFVAESTFDHEPLNFVSGDGTLITTLDEFLVGLKEGDEGQLVVTPSNGYGERDEENVHQMQRSEFSDEIKMEKGLIIGFCTPAGDEIPGTVLDVNDEQVTMDFNHPFAGHEVTFDIQVLSVAELH